MRPNHKKELRSNLKKHAKSIISHLDKHYLTVTGERKSKRADICMFCGAAENITKEHVLPKWVFLRNPDKFFVTKINGLSHKYNRTTLPACVHCNSVILNSLEKEINRLFSRFAIEGNFFSINELEDIIRWLELIDYKFQIFSLRTRFHALKKAKSIPHLTVLSISVLDPAVNYSPFKVLSVLRKSLRRITMKSKAVCINSLVIFKTRNANMHFWHKNNDHMFLELPQKGIALFYFFEKTFANITEAHQAAMNIIRKEY